MFAFQITSRVVLVKTNRKIGSKDNHLIKYHSNSIRNTNFVKLKVIMSANDKAQGLKLQGNEAYKKKDFHAASNFFEEAIQTDPTEITFYTNLAAVQFETKVRLNCDSPI